MSKITFLHNEDGKVAQLSLNSMWEADFVMRTSKMRKIVPLGLTSKKQWTSTGEANYGFGVIIEENANVKTTASLRFATSKQKNQNASDMFFFPVGPDGKIVTVKLTELEKVLLEGYEASLRFSNGNTVWTVNGKRDGERSNKGSGDYRMWSFGEGPIEISGVRFTIGGDVTQSAIAAVSGDTVIVKAGEKREAASGVPSEAEMDEMSAKHEADLAAHLAANGVKDGVTA